MSTIAHDTDASLADFMARWSRILRDYVMPEGFALIALTNYGERPVPSPRLAEVVGRPVSEIETLARQLGWPPRKSGMGSSPSIPNARSWPPGAGSRSVTAGSA